MTLVKDTHLNEKQIVQAVVDITDLPVPLQEHLLSCDECHGAKIKFEQEVEALGRKAAAYVPDPLKRIHLPLEHLHSSKKSTFQWRGPLGVAVTALLILCLTWGIRQIQPSPDETENRLVLKQQEAEVLIMEVNMLAENALPQVYIDLSAEIETDFENLLLEYIIPLPEEGSLSLKSGKKEATSC